MFVGRDFSVWGWAKNTELLDDHAELVILLEDICKQIEMEPLQSMGINIPFEVEKLGRSPFGDEGGALAVVVLGTSHAAIHGWPIRCSSREDGGLFLFNLQSCREFSSIKVKNVLYDRLRYTLIDDSEKRMVIPDVR